MKEDQVKAEDSELPMAYMQVKCYLRQWSQKLILLNMEC